TVHGARGRHVDRPRADLGGAMAEIHVLPVEKVGPVEAAEPPEEIVANCHERAVDPVDRVGARAEPGRQASERRVEHEMPERPGARPTAPSAPERAAPGSHRPRGSTSPPPATPAPGSSARAPTSAAPAPGATRASGFTNTMTSPRA